MVEATMTSRPAGPRPGDPHSGRGLASSLLGVAALLLLIAPLAMPSDYSWLTHTTSESAAQGLTGAWVARTGFVLFGVAVLARSARWPRPARVFHQLFGACMVAAGVYSSRPWRDVPHDVVEDVLHSAAATAMGFAFAFGVVAVAWHRGRAGVRPTGLDVAAVMASVVLPLGMVAVPEWAGLLQRTMFAIAFAWYFTARPETSAPTPTG